LLFYTGISRISSDIAKEQIDNTKKNKEMLLIMRSLVDDAYKVLSSGKNEFKEFGRLLDHTWKIKKSLSSKICTSEIDKIYDTAIKAGAIGGKLLGAGGGGFIVFYAEPEYHNKVKESLKDYLCVPFKFSFSGSEIIVYQPNFFL
jgi:D-glycero-alpha-D-manno-heptose-7-phosphate kinase